MYLTRSVTYTSILALALAAPVGLANAASDTTTDAEAPAAVQAQPEQGMEPSPAPSGAGVETQQAQPAEVQAPEAQAPEAQAPEAQPEEAARAEQAGPAVPSPEGMVEQQEEGQSLASTVIGRPIVNSEGQNIGEIADLLLDQDQRVVGVVISVGGFLGLGSKPVGLPWDRLQLVNQDGEQIARIDLTEDQLAAAPTFRTRAEIERDAAKEAAAQENLKQMRQDLSEGVGGGVTPPQE